MHPLLFTCSRAWQWLLTPLLVCALLFPPVALFANPLVERNREETAIDTISAPQATNDTTNVYYQFTSAAPIASTVSTSTPTRTQPPVLLPMASGQISC